jgi:hypothetical protein
MGMNGEDLSQDSKRQYKLHVDFEPKLDFLYALEWQFCLHPIFGPFLECPLQIATAFLLDERVS